MKQVHIGPVIKEKCPGLRLACLQADVLFSEEAKALWQLIDTVIEERQMTLKETSAIAQMTAIRETRVAYKSCGKDPARYRASAESLLRRVLQGKGLYRVNNVVDLLNLVSIRSGFSIGGYDLAKIEGSVTLGIGTAEEAYSGIGRGALNIEFLPVLRDEQSAFGSPTSDSLRTMVTDSISDFLMVFFAFGPTADLHVAMDLAEKYLAEFGGAKSVKKWIVN